MNINIDIDKDSSVIQIYNILLKKNVYIVTNNNPAYLDKLHIYYCLGVNILPAIMYQINTEVLHNINIECNYLIRLGYNNNKLYSEDFELIYNDNNADICIINNNYMSEIFNIIEKIYLRSLNSHFEQFISILNITNISNITQITKSLDIDELINIIVKDNPNTNDIDNPNTNDIDNIDNPNTNDIDNIDNPNDIDNIDNNTIDNNINIDNEDNLIEIKTHKLTLINNKCKYCNKILKRVSALAKHESNCKKNISK